MGLKNWVRGKLVKAALDKPDAAAYRAFDTGNLREAEIEFNSLVEANPQHHEYAYMLGLAHKYQRNWVRSLQHNLRAAELASKPDQGSCWNAAIAATALGNWPEARRQWVACGVKIDPGESEIEQDFGTVSLRLNPWGTAETLYANRIDPARAYLMNVPLPASGYRFRDLVLHDGAQTGERQFSGRAVPVFNVLQRLRQSDFMTFAAFVVCPAAEDCNDACDRTGPGIGLVEDWSGVSYYCLRCSYGAPHDHNHEKRDLEWEPDRSLGIAAQSRLSVERLLAQWVEDGPGRRVDSIELAQEELQEPEDGCVWWREPDPD